MSKSTTPARPAAIPPARAGLRAGGSRTITPAAKPATKAAAKPATNAAAKPTAAETPPPAADNASTGSAGA